VGITNFLVKLIYLSKKQDHQKEKIVVNISLLLLHFRETKIINTENRNVILFPNTF